MSKTTPSHLPSITPAAVSARFGIRRRGSHPHLAGHAHSSRFAGHSPTVPTPAAASPAKAHRRTRRIDLTVAILVSVGAHLSLVLFSGDAQEEITAPAQPSPTAIEVAVFELPEPEETPVEVTDSEPSDVPPVEFAPPMQADLPSFVSVDSFVQPMQATVPTGLSTDVGMLVVPTTPAIGRGGNAPKLFQMSELDRAPNRLRTVLPTYPPEFRRSGIEGDVLLLLVIDPTGHVRVIRVLETSGAEFSRAAIAAAEQCRYEAPKKGGHPVSATYQLRVPFRLANVAAAR